MSNRTSNLVAELYNYGRGLEDTDRGSLCIRGAREIERLTAELAHAEAVRDGYLWGRTELLAERDRLREENTITATELRGCHEELRRLRAALQKIKNRILYPHEPAEGTLWDVVRDADEALAGGEK